MREPTQLIIDPMAMIESMTESVLVTTTDLDPPGPFIVYVNAAFEKMTGWSRDALMGKTPRILQGPKTDQRVFEALRTRLAEGKAWSGQATNYRRDGSEFVMEWSIVPVRDQRGEVYCYLAVQRDVTRRVAMQKALAVARAEERRRFRQLEKTNQQLSDLNREQRRTLELFAKYVPETVVKKGLAAYGGSLLQGERLDIVALFCDICGFTRLSERLDPNRVVELLNTYYTMMAEVIQVNEGTVVQFVGDEIFAAFGAPLPIRDCVESALRCALGMVDRLAEINHQVAAFTGDDLRVGVGLNFGTVIAGNLGSKQRLSYSITGDTVNTAKRIESLAKNGTNTILIGESVYRRARHRVLTEALPAISLKGKQRKVPIYRLIGFRADGSRDPGDG